ncbi:FadR/GntR family transcriptional regulator [Amycolatopsis taiwanensis]|uniref:GntR family transcriptional regulator n=1 Tax=Amycolatopsis taiwanensis TaxID=342230 RepID=A0A9W6R009_9PSEU|nr:FadR/GntR family transcriptional regulator [Amycolatopsis taiwanensis]GLY67106.1 GntR family transcriptional regulator [Amycolatopsis taiwanensis]
MPLASTRRSGLVDQAIEQLRDAIKQEEWPVGQRIPTEAALAESLGVGRNTVREAVRALAHGGLLEVRQGDGTYVRATSEVCGAIRRICGSELREVLQVRRALEVEGARLAAVNRTDADLAALNDLMSLREQARRSDDQDAFVRADTEFHRTIIQSGRNALLVELYRGITEAVAASVVATSAPPEIKRVELAHRDLLAAIAAGDEDRAAAEAGDVIDQLLAPREEVEAPFKEEGPGACPQPGYRDGAPVKEE